MECERLTEPEPVTLSLGLTLPLPLVLVVALPDTDGTRAVDAVTDTLADTETVDVLVMLTLTFIL